MSEKVLKCVFIHGRAINVCILYVLIMYLNYLLSCCTYYNLYNGENEVGTDFRHVLYFIIHCKRLKTNYDFRGESVR